MHTSPEPGNGATITTAQMTAAVLDRFGSVEELQLRQIPVPEVRTTDVLIRVEFAGVGSWDAVEREGDYDGVFGVASSFPYVLGWDAAGRVAAVGPEVTRFAVGDRVYAASTPLPRGGFYAEYGVVDEQFVAHVPERLPTAQAGAMAWDALTALSGLDVLQLQADESLMIFGASGGIGHMAVQLARHRGARVMAVASGDDGVALAGRLGADVVIDGRTADVLAAAASFAPSGLDAALLTVGGENAEQSLRAIRSTGRVAWPHGVQPVPGPAAEATLLPYDGDRGRAATDLLNSIIDESTFEVSVAETFPLAEVRSAHLALRDHYVGKLALAVS